MTDREKFYKLQWKVWKYKLFYYFPDKVHASWHQDLQVTDQEYDGIEQEYKTLAGTLGMDTRASTMVGFKEDEQTRWVVRVYAKEKPNAEKRNDNPPLE